MENNASLGRFYRCRQTGVRLRRRLSIAAGVVSMLGLAYAHADELRGTLSPGQARASADQAFSWTGAYGGLSGGYDWAGSTNAWSAAALLLSAPIFANLASTIDASGSRGMRQSGASVGAQVGYLIQATPLIGVGVEADLEWSGLRGGLDTPGVLPAPSSG